MGNAYDRAKNCLLNGANEAGTAWALLAIADAIEETKESLLDLGDLKYIADPMMRNSMNSAISSMGSYFKGGIPKADDGTDV